jgi:hypothetical protein
MDENKKKIINMFISNVQGKVYDSTGFNTRHDGAEGHWLERLMGIAANASNEADLFGYEMKKPTRSKTTFGDWSPDVSLWGKNRPYDDIDRLDRDTEFLVYFGKPNPLKKNRYSWSGEPSPTIKGYNNFGQILKVDEKNNILACYSFSEDKRADKEALIPQKLKKEDLIIAKWSAHIMKEKVERKFNDNGWFKCFKNASGVYEAIGFGDPIEYEDWIELVKSGTVFFDSGMYQGNVRPYSQWRANNNYWDELIDERYTDVQS